MRITYTRTRKAEFQTSASKVLQLLQDDPLAYLNVAGVEVSQELTRTADSGEWIVVEKLSIPLIPNTTFKTKFTRIEKGSRWQSWASLGVYVDNSFTIDDDDRRPTENSAKPDQDDDTTCSATEVATLQCPFYLYPLVRWQFDKNHDANMIKLQEYVVSQRKEGGAE